VKKYMPLKSIHKRKNYKMAKIDPIIAVKDIEASPNNALFICELVGKTGF
jgi:hypothetical protein